MKPEPSSALAVDDKNSASAIMIASVKANKAAMFILNGLLFQLGWFSAVLGGNAVALGVMLAILMIHQLLFIRHKSEWLFIVLVGVIGIVVDSTLSLSNVLLFSSTAVGIPTWLFCIWILFACTINHSLSWLKDRPLVAIVMGGFAGPSSYFAGSKLSDVAFAEPLFQSLTIVVIVWAILLPLLMMLSKKINANDTDDKYANE